MKLSFVIPAHNEELLLPGTLYSIEREVNSHPDATFDETVEVFVINNASTDNTAGAARQFSFAHVVDEPQKGLVRARHAGFAASRGVLVANVDADTQLPPGWLATVLREFEKDPNLVALSGPYVYTDLPFFTGLIVRIFYFFGWLGHLFNHYILGAGTMIQGGNFIIRRDAWERAGGFDTTIEFYGEDTDVAKRIAKTGKIKWTWRLPMYTSGRRLRHEGVLRTGYVYALNFFSVTLFGKPATKDYTDIRL